MDPGPLAQADDDESLPPPRGVRPCGFRRTGRGSASRGASLLPPALAGTGTLPGGRPRDRAGRARLPLGRHGGRSQPIRRIRVHRLPQRPARPGQPLRQRHPLARAGPGPGPLARDRRPGHRPFRPEDAEVPPLPSRSLAPGRASRWTGRRAPRGPRRPPLGSLGRRWPRPPRSGQLVVPGLPDRPGRPRELARRPSSWRSPRTHRERSGPGRPDGDS